MMFYEKAIEMLDAEAEKQQGTHYRVIENYIRERIKGREDLAQKVTDKKNPLSGAYNAIYEIAKKHRQSGGGNCVCVAPDEAWEAVDKFFGFTDEPLTVATGKVVSLFDML